MPLQPGRSLSPYTVTDKKASVRVRVTSVQHAGDGGPPPYFTQSDGPSSHLLWVKRITCRSDSRIAWISP